ncbi:hypothetical protein RIF29_38664 [Crotalaria pallida]|uniref:Uncharacterized protein n=1 Tax=Crotalaria pallida TaxID=3830 RepID=A0AAN9E1L9_CROPI
MARKRRRPPKTPSSVNKSASNKDSDQNGTPSKVDFSQLDDDDIEDIDNLTPKQAGVWIQKIDVLRAKIQERTDPTSSKDKSDKSDASHDNITPNPSLTEKVVHDKPSSDSIADTEIPQRTSVLPDEVFFEDEKGTLINQKVIYEWKPVLYAKCSTYGHDSKMCRKGTKQVWVVKNKPSQQDIEEVVGALKVQKAIINETIPPENGV